MPNAAGDLEKGAFHLRCRLLPGGRVSLTHRFEGYLGEHPEVGPVELDAQDALLVATRVEQAVMVIDHAIARARLETTRHPGHTHQGPANSSEM